MVKFHPTVTLRSNLINILILLVISYCDLYSQKILKIEIEGLTNVKRRQVLEVMKLKVKKNFSIELIKEDIKSISELGFFETIEYKFDEKSGILKITVKEKPLLKKITFKGNKSISDGKLKEKLSVKKDDFIDEYKIKKSISDMLSLYEENGFVNTSIEYDYYTEEKNRAILTFFIKEGEKYLIEDIVIKGTKHFKPHKIIKMLKLKKKKLFKEPEMEEGIKNIKNFYQSRGFQKVNVSYEKILTGQFVKIIININEGAKYKIKSVEFTGNTVVTGDELKKISKIKKDDICNIEKINTTINLIKEIYADKGYLKAEVQPYYHFDDEKAKISIEFMIEENEIIYVNEIYIEGNHTTKTHVIKREIDLEKNKPLYASKVRKSIERLYNLGFLDEVSVNFLPTNHPNRVNVVFSITEGKPGMLSAGAGYSSVDGLVGTTQVSHLNLFGLGQRLNLLVEFGGRRQNYEINWTEPYILNKPVSFGISLYNLTRDRDYNEPRYIYNAYKETRQGFGLRIGPRLDEFLFLFMNYSLEFLKLHDIHSEIPPHLLKEFSSINSGCSIQLAYDTRDNIFDPTKGSRNSITFHISGGPFLGDLHYHKTTLKSSWFLPTFWELVLAINFSIGFMGKLYPEMEETKITPEKFVMGGPDTVRGYQYSEIGRGYYMILGNLEYKFPIAKEKGRTILQGAFFVDSGAVWDNVKDITLKFGEQPHNLRAGVGFGLRFVTPVFPIRFDWGYPLNPTPGTIPSLQFYFTLGQIF